MEEREDNPSPLERMRTKLYTPGTSFDIQPSALSARTSKMPHTWEEEAPKGPTKQPRFKFSASALFLMGAVAFFVIAGLIAFFLVVQGGRSVSTDRVFITIENPPTSIAGGDTVSLFVIVRNENPAALTDAKLVINFPDGTYSATDATEPLTHQIENLGTIGAGESVKRTVQATLFGEANQGISIPMTLEYKTEGSSAVFEKKQNFEFTIGTSPVSVNVTALSEISSGQEMSFEISVRSNASTPIDNLGLYVSPYPSGFSVTKTDPKPAGNLFVLGTLAPGQEKKVTITGTLMGQDKDERVFHFSAGTVKADGSQSLGTTFITKETSVEITRPFIAVSLALDRSEEDTVVIAPERDIQGMLSWTNTLSSQIQDAELTVKLNGAALDKNSVSSSGGFYRSSDTTILFNRDTSPGLRTLQPGDSGTGSFSFKTKSASELSGLHNPAIEVTVSIAGRRVGESGVAERVTSTISRTVQVASALSLGATASRSSGPTQPTPDVESTYTVRFNVDNGVNAIADSVVKATLPSYVRFVGSTSGVAYNATTREVSWTIGEIAAHASGKSASFDIAFLPSSSQSGSAPVIVASPTLTGFDRFVQKTVTATAPSIDSGLRVK